MNDQSPARKSPALVVASSAIEQVKRHQITKAIVMDVMKNRTNLVKLGNNQFQFMGSSSHPTTYITGQYSPDQKQWLITNIEIMDRVSSSEPPPHADPIVKSDQQDTLLPVISFTKHAREVLQREFLDHRVVEHIIQYPDKKQHEDDGKVRFIGASHGDRLHIIAKFLEKENKWLVITVQLRYKQDTNTLVDISQFDGEPTDKHPGVKFTAHAHERMKLRKIYPSDVKETILHPEKRVADEGDKVKFIGKQLSLNRAIHVVGKFLPEENKWLVVSVWVRGEEDDGSLSTWKPTKTRPVVYRQKPLTFRKPPRKASMDMGFYLFIFLIAVAILFIASRSYTVP